MFEEDFEKESAHIDCYRTASMAEQFYDYWNLNLF